ncbi:MAG TPA: efflux RND transporter periplasmic adaptor subunit [Opitutaceae bacterium]|nr:efflux RND transporter periplasmic adaptor subunit [Opitutaceae bacterium]
MSLVVSSSKVHRAPRRHSFSPWPALALVALVFSAGCGEKSSAGGGGGGRGGRGGGGGPAPVVVGKVERKVVPVVIDAIGSVEPIRSAAIRSQVTGTLKRIAIQEGQDVKENDIVFEIDPRSFENALHSAEADRERIHVQLENARTQVARYRSLSAESMVSKEQFQKMQDDARALEAQAQSSEAAVANAKLQLDYCTIRAPFAGRTGNLSVHEGDLVRANDVGAMVTVNQLSPIYVTFGVPQQHLAALNKYRAAGTLAVSAAPPGDNPQLEQGELTFIDNTVDPTTGTIKLKGTFPNEAHRLWPGQFVTASVTLTAPEVLTVAAGAVQTSQTGQHVFVVKDDHTAELREVVIERTSGDVAVVAKGLSEGETVVTDGQLRVIPGRPVEIRQPDAPAGGGETGRGRGEGGRGKGKEGKGRKT